jgi:hypothetical protein
MDFGECHWKNNLDTLPLFQSWDWGSLNEQWDQWVY